VKVAPDEPATRTRVSYWRKLGGRPYGPSRMIGKDFSCVGRAVVGRRDFARS